MRVPSLTPGTHKLTLTVDTKTLLGVLTAERTVIIEDPAITALANAYIKARAAGNTARASELTRKLIAKRFSHQIRPGQTIPVDKTSVSSKGATPESTSDITWYPEKDHLRVVVQMLDTIPASNADQAKARYRMQVGLFVCPSGADKDICAIVLSNETDSNNAFMGTIRDGKMLAQDPKHPVIATWERTPDGYCIEAKIPWGMFKGLPTDWTKLPVEVWVATSQRGVAVYSMAGTDSPEKSARNYWLLSRK